MSDAEHLGRRLQAMAAKPAPPVDPTFADHLDTRLRVLHAEHHGSHRGRSGWTPAVVGSLALVFVAVVFAAVVALDRSPEVAVVLTAAADTDVVFPGAGATAARAGLELSDGTRIIVGDDGEAVVNGVVLGPGSEALVVSDQIDVVVTVLDMSDREGRQGNGDRATDDTITATTAGRSSTIDRQPTSPDTTDGTDRSNDRPGDGSDDGGGATTAASAGPSSTTSAPATTASTEPPGSTRATDGATTSTTAAQPEPLELIVTPIDRSRLRLAWMLNRELNDVAGWRVVVTHGDRETPVVAIRDQAARRTTIERSIAAGGNLRVEALDVDGQVLLESSPVAVPSS